MRTSPPVPVLVGTDEPFVDLRDEAVVDVPEPGIDLREEVIIDLRDEACASPTVTDTPVPATSDGTMAVSAVVVGLAALLAVLALWWLQVGPSCPPLTDPSCVVGI